MNNGTVLSSSQVQAYIYNIYIETINTYALLASLTVLTYASLLHLAIEVEYIWKRNFTLATYLYLFAKYFLFAYFSIFLFEELWPPTISLGLCNKLGILIQIIFAPTFIGEQGLMLLRAYSLCRGYRPVSIVLFTASLTSFAIFIYEITVPYCTPLSLPASLQPAGIMNDIALILFDTLAFIVTIWQVWGLWRLKRGLGLQSNQDVVTLVLRQCILKFCFTLFITTTQLLISFFSTQEVADIFNPFQNMLLAVLMCELTMDLRQRNTPRAIPNPSAFSLPTLSFQENPVQSVRSVLGRLHESIVAEMGERNDLTDGPNLGEGPREPDDLQNDPHGMDSNEELPVQDT